MFSIQQYFIIVVSPKLKYYSFIVYQIRKKFISSMFFFTKTVLYDAYNKPSFCLVEHFRLQPITIYCWTKASPKSANHQSWAVRIHPLSVIFFLNFYISGPVQCWVSTSCLHMSCREGCTGWKPWLSVIAGSTTRKHDETSHLPPNLDKFFYRPSERSCAGQVGSLSKINAFLYILDNNAINGYGIQRYIHYFWSCQWWTLEGSKFHVGIMQRLCQNHNVVCNSQVWDALNVIHTYIHTYNILSTVLKKS